MIETRAEEAALGHVAPHDLRRTVANILYKAKISEGAHFFDLRDIQRVLGHSRPETTVKAYMDPIDTEATERAARFFD
jgi:integrase